MEKSPLAKEEAVRRAFVAALEEAESQMPRTHLLLWKALANNALESKIEATPDARYVIDGEHLRQAVAGQGAAVGSMRATLKDLQRTQLRYDDGDIFGVAVLLEYVGIEEGDTVVYRISKEVKVAVAALRPPGERPAP